MRRLLAPAVRGGLGISGSLYGALTAFIWAGLVRIASFGESWHNGHHSQPGCARHGRGPRQIDPSAGLIRLLERLRWATNVHWQPADVLGHPRMVAGKHTLRTSKLGGR
ncbi:hypothetical protein [Nonomuraea sp. NPDC049684]|uniref:hypothetical protein n=1 Tax=Nonomuraea sp. NPDC049684 TaxID=3364356 RepID=UPI0037879BA0